MAFRLFWARFFEFFNPINWVMPKRRKRIHWAQALRMADDVGDDLKRTTRFVNKNDAVRADRQLKEFTKDFETAARMLHETGTQVALQMNAIAVDLKDLEIGLKGRLATETPRLKRLLCDKARDLEIKFREINGRVMRIDQVRRRDPIEPEELRRT